jgi:hypothetical protein
VGIGAQPAQAIDDLLVAGSPPPSFESVRQRLQATAGSGVDYVFDIPVEVAAAICEYRYGQLQFEWGDRDLRGSTSAKGRERPVRDVLQRVRSTSGYGKIAISQRTDVEGHERFNDNHL